MQVSHTQHFPNDGKYHTVKIDKLEPVKRTVNLKTPKDRVRFIQQVERQVRSSLENKEFTAFLKKNIDMVRCSFFNGIDSSKQKKVRIEIHHEPFTLFDLVNIVLTKWETEGKPLSYLFIAEEVAKLHYDGKVGLIPLSLTIHKLVHRGDVIIPLQRVHGDFLGFLQEYEDYISDDYKEMLKEKLEDSKNFKEEDLSILETRYVYLDNGSDELERI